MTSGWIKFVVLAALVCVSLSEKENSNTKNGGSTPEALTDVEEPVAFVFEPLTGELFNVPVTRVVEDEDKAKAIAKRWFGGRGSISAGLNRNGIHVGGQYTNGRHRFSGGYSYGRNGHSLGLSYSFGKKK